MSTVNLNHSVLDFRQWGAQAQIAKPFAQGVGLAPHKSTFGTRLAFPTLAFPTWNTKDEFVSTEPISSVTYKRPVAHKHAPIEKSSPTIEHLEMETEVNPMAEQPDKMSRLLLAIVQVLEDNGIVLKEDDVLTGSISEDGIFSIKADESSIGGVTGEELNELCIMLSEKLNAAQFEEEQTLGNAFKQVTEQAKETLIRQYADEQEVDPEELEIKDINFLLSFSFGFNPETGQNEVFGLKFQLLDTISGDNLFTTSGQSERTPSAATSEPENDSKTEKNVWNGISAGGGVGLPDAQRNTLQQALNQNRQFFEMKHRANLSDNKRLGEFTMPILDAHGKVLAKDQVQFIAGGSPVITSIDTIRDVNQQVWSL